VCREWRKKLLKRLWKNKQRAKNKLVKEDKKSSCTGSRPATNKKSLALLAERGGDSTRE